MSLSTEKKDLNITLKVSIKDMISKVKISDIVNCLNLIICKVEVEGTKQGVFRIRQYQDTIKFLENYKNDYFENYDHLLEYYQENKKKATKILLKIKEYFDTGFIEEAEKAKKDPRVLAVINLTKIYGIGPKKAIELNEKHKITNVDELLTIFQNDNSVINAKQTIGLTHYHDLCERIPKSEMDHYNQVLKEVCNKVSPNIIMSINGSYRREMPDSGDIDLLITSKNEDPSVLRKRLIDELKKQEIIIEILADGKKKFMGISRLTKYGYNKSRHIDIMDTKFNNFPFAVLYFTGSGAFNAKMRGNALKLGYSLNEYCLSDKDTKVEISPKVIKDKINKETFEFEEDIFKFLNMTYLLPRDRNLKK